MPFPTVNAATTGVQTSNVSTHSFLLPATINAGEILMVSAAFDGNPTVTWDQSTAGTWTVLTDQAQTTLAKLVIYWKRADGTEGGTTLSVTTSVVEQSVYRAIAVGDVHATQAPVAGTAAVATSANPNPPPVTAPWGADDNMFFAIMANDDGRRTMTVYPSTYPDGRFNDNSAGVAGVGLSSARREFDSASDDPPAATISASQGWVAQTVVMRGIVLDPRSATFTQTDDADAITADGTVVAPTATGTLVQEDSADAVTASGEVTTPPVLGTLAVTDEADAGTSTAQAPAAATLTQTDAADGTTAAGTVETVGALSATDEADGITATGTVADPGLTATLALSDADDAVVFAGIVPALATTAVTDDADTFSATAVAPVAGTAAPTDATDGLTAAAGTPASAVAAASDADDSTVASAQALAAATLALTDGADTLDGQAGAPAALGTLAQTDAADGLAATGGVAYLPVAGTLAQTDAADGVASGATAPAAGALAQADAADGISAAAGARATANAAFADAPDGVAGLARLLAAAVLAGSDDPDTLAASADGTPAESFATFSVMDAPDVVTAIGHALATALLDVIDDSDGPLHQAPTHRVCPPTFEVARALASPVVVSLAGAQAITVGLRASAHVVDVNASQESIVMASHCPPIATITHLSGRIARADVIAPGPRGPRGDPGDSGAEITFSGTNDDLTAFDFGTPVTSTPTGLKRSNTSALYRVTGLALGPIPVGETGLILAEGSVNGTVLQWDAATGMVGGLVPNVPYFLSDDGRITPTPPMDTADYLVVLGRALSPTELLLQIEPPIDL